MIRNYILESSRISKRYFFLVILWMGILTMNAQTPCNRPENLAVQSIYANGGTVTWDAPNPVPSQGYEYFWSASQSNAPNSGSVPDGSTFSRSVTITGNFIPGATIYVWVRAVCSSGDSLWRGPVNFTIIPAGNGCPVAPNGVNPIAPFTPAYTGTPELINADAYTGQYCKVNLMENRRYIFNTSNASDYITIANINTAEVIAHGPSPLTYNNYFAGPVRYYINSNSSCSSQEVIRSRYITAQLIPTGCAAPGEFYTSSISTNGAIIHWNDTNAVYPANFEYYYNTSSTTPNINDTPSGTTTFEYKALTGLLPNTTYYYWLRSNCSAGMSNWAYAGSFTTQAAVVNGCVSAVYGQNPSTIFIPGCSGSPEIISTNMWAGEYTLINVLPNKIYTFTSSVATDFITIRDEATSVAYASGTTPLTWSSGANTTQIKMFVHLSVSCGSNEVNRTTTITCQNASSDCPAPSALAITAVTNASANLSWTAATPSPIGYQYYYSSVNTPPTSGSTPLGNTAANSMTLNGLNSNTTYYFWVRSNCGSNQSVWVFGNSFTTVGAGTGCTIAVNGQYPDATFTPTCFGNNEVIVTDAYAGEYSRINISANTQYTFSSSIASDYITITNYDASVTYIAGNTPLVWNSGSNSGEIRYYFHVNSACGANGTNRTKYIACQSASPCNAPTGLSASSVTGNSATLNWTAVSPVPGGGYQYYFGMSSTAPTGSTAPSGSTTSASVTLTSLNGGVTYYFWVRSNCSSSQSGWSSVWSFTTQLIPIAGCTQEVWGQYPTNIFTPSCGGGNEVIVTDAYAGEHSMVTIVPNKQYTFSTSKSGDYITIANNDSSVVYASGTTPVVWFSGVNSGTYRYYIHTGSDCGADTAPRIRWIACTQQLQTAEAIWDDFQWHPNPVKEVLYISSHVTIVDRVEIINMLGQTIRIQQANAFEIPVDFSRFANGVYIVRAFSGTKAKIFRVIKE